MMVDDILQLAYNQQFLERITNASEIGGDLELLSKLPEYNKLTEFENNLKNENKINFSTIFNEPVGQYLFQTFLYTEYSVDKAIFINDVKTFKTLNDPSARHNVAFKIYDRFCGPERDNHIQGISVFSNFDESKQDGNMPWYAIKKNEELTKSNQYEVVETISDELTITKSKSINNNYLLTSGTNTIGIYGKSIKTLKHKIDNNLTNDVSLFDAILSEVYNDLRLDVFPRFEKSIYYKTYIKYKSMESKFKCSISNFQTLRTLGKGAFGLVNAVEKRDCCKLYAIKQINKKRVFATNNLKTVMQERNYLCLMNSNFVTSLKYAFADQDQIYLVLDIMLGGDLKYHLNFHTKFNEERAIFHAAQILLGLQHIHSKGIVYRDLKLENVLIDKHGHCQISDLGLAVLQKDGNGVRGYAGTPGYTAPEVILGFYYGSIADFFSLGVLVYRCLCGSKPFLRKKHKKTKRDKKNKSSVLDRNVIEMEPEYNPHYFSSKSRSFLKGLMAKNPSNRLGYFGINDIKQHPFFDNVDFGLLEAGYLAPPFNAPNLKEIYSPINGNDVAPPTKDQDFVNVKITSEFENSLKDFEYVDKETLQKEFVQVLERSDALKMINDTQNNQNNMDDQRDPYQVPKKRGCIGCQVM